jgi:hypothetical protein
MMKGEEYNMMSFAKISEMFLPEESYIQTSTLNRFLDICLILADTHHHHPMMGIATRPAGIGKSTSLYLCQVQLAQAPLSATSIVIQVHPRSTPHSLTVQLSGTLQGVLHAKRQSSRLDDLVETILHSNLSLIMLDEADRLNDACLECLCALFDLTRCPILLVGLPPFPQRTQKLPQLLERAGIYAKLSPPSFQEILDRVLPALSLPGWSFDPTRESDRHLAEQLWEYTAPSLRRLRNILSIASTLAHVGHEPGITPASIEYAMQQVPPPFDRTHRTEIPSDNKKKKLIHPRIHTLRSQDTGEAIDMSSIQNCFSNERGTSQAGGFSEE